MEWRGLIVRSGISSCKKSTSRMSKGKQTWNIILFCSKHSNILQEFEARAGASSRRDQANSECAPRHRPVYGGYRPKVCLLPAIWHPQANHVPSQVLASSNRAPAPTMSSESSPPSTAKSSRLPPRSPSTDTPMPSSTFSLPRPILPLPCWAPTRSLM